MQPPSRAAAVLLMKTMKSAIALFAFAAATFAAVPAHATRFIYDVKLIGGTKSETDSLKSTYQAQGWKVIDKDLNSGCGGSSDYIYLLYKDEESYDNRNYGYITDLKLVQGYGPSGEIYEMFSRWGHIYNLVSYEGGRHFTELKGDLNSNTKGDVIHLYYTRSEFNDGDGAPSCIWFDENTSSVNGNSLCDAQPLFSIADDGSVVRKDESGDLNRGCGEGTDYIYMFLLFEDIGNSPWSGKGTSDWPFWIENEAGWTAAVNAVANGTACDRSYSLINDISISHMLGTSEHPFSGNFFCGYRNSGNHYKLTVNISGSEQGMALFHHVKGATIEDVVVEGSVSSTAYHAAGLVGLCDGGTIKVSGCTVSANVNGKGYVGGIVGHGGSCNITIENSVFGGTISGYDNGYAGGLLGWCDAATVTLRNDLFKGAFAPSSGGLSHPVACKNAGSSVAATSASVYYLNTVAPTATGNYVLPGIETLPVSEISTGQWNKPVTAADGLQYYAESVEFFVSRDNGNDANDGHSSATPFRTIQKAIESADSYDTIRVASGVYEPFDVGGLVLTIVGAGAESTVVDGDSGALTCAKLSSGTVLRGFRLQNGECGASGGRLEDCIVENCTGAGTDSIALDNVDTSRCIVRNCSLPEGGVVVGGKHSNGLFYGHSARSVIDGATFYNCTIADNNALTSGDETGSVANAAAFYDCIAWDNNLVVNSQGSLSWDGNDEVDPKFVDATNGNYRLRGDSPAINAGDGLYPDEVGETDIEGNPRVQGEKIDRGCYETKGFTVTVTVTGHGSASPASSFAFLHESVTLTADTTQWGTTVIGWYTNGVMAAESGNTFTLANVEEDILVNVVFSRVEFYVDGTNGNDGNNGLSPSTAFKTIQAAIDSPSVLDRDSIHVAAGVYAPFSTSDSSRDLNKELMLIGEGSVSTIIDGGGLEFFMALYNSITKKSTTLRGFTLRNWNGGVSDGFLENCIVHDINSTNGYSFASGNVFRQCVVYDCSSETCDGNYYNTLLYRLNVSKLSEGRFYNCTIADCTLVGAYHGWFICRNCILWGNDFGHSGDVANDSVDPLFVNAAAGDYHLWEDSPAIGSGNPDYGSDAGDTDLDGNPRLLGGRISRGCYEGKAVVVEATEIGCGSVSPSRFVGYTPVTVTFKANTSKWNRVVTGWYTNGVLAAATGDTFTLANITNSVAVAVKFAVLDLFVDAVNGSDANDGLASATAFKTIQKAIEVSAPCDTIHVSSGTYAPFDVGGRAISIVGAGANRTIVDGGGTQRCATLSDGTTLQGFTLRNGHDNSHYGCGGVLGGVLVNCIVENCNGIECGGVRGSDTLRCIIRNCTSTVCILGGGTHRNSLLYGLRCNRIFESAALVNCTIADNQDLVRFNDWGAVNSSVVNCVLWGNWNNNDAEDPMFVNAEGGDYRPRAGSPAIDSGNSNYANEVGETDLAGNARVQGNAIDRGCYEGPGVQCLVCKAIVEGGGAVMPTYIVTNAPATVTFTTDKSGWGRPVVGWYTNGVLAVESGDTFTIADVMQDTKVVVRFAPTNFYVNAATGSDENDGLTSATAMRTIQRAIDVSASRDTIYVAAGTYSPIDVGGRALSIIGAGKDVTVIDAGGTNRCAALSKGTTLEGFTLRNGLFGASDGTLEKCIIENCVNSGWGYILSGVNTHRCIVRNCTYSSTKHDNIAVDGGVHRDSLFHGINMISGRIFSNATLYNCTAADNSYTENPKSTQISNCILWGNSNGNDAEDPKFVYAAGGDYRLRAGSPAIDGGDPDYANESGEIDLAGNVRVQGERIDRGCYEGGVNGFLALSKVEGRGIVSPNGAFVINSSESVLFTADTSMWGFPILGWYTNGVWATGAQNQFLLEDIAEDIVVTVKFQPGSVCLYVDGASGDDANDGTSPARALRTIQRAIDVSWSNDTIRVAPGTYGPIDVGGRVLAIIGTGANATAIDGGGKNRCARLAEGTTLRGFTLRNGYTDGWAPDENFLEYANASVEFGKIEDCIVDNCRADHNAEVLFKTDTSRCIVRNCLATNYVIVGGVHCCSLIHGNRSECVTVLADVESYNCTIADNTTAYPCVAYGTIVNSVRWGNSYKVTAGMGVPDQNDSCDPLFVDAANGNYRLRKGSPAINSGDSAYADRAGATDLDGNSRVQNGKIDRGCYEAPAGGGYGQWAWAWGLGAADEVTDGEYNLIRYVYDKPRGEFAAITNVYLNAAGRPVVQARVPENTEGVTLKVLSSGDLTDWSKAEWKELTVESGGTLVFEDDTDPRRFYRLKAE